MKNGFIFDVLDQHSDYYQDTAITNVTQVVCKNGYTLDRPDMNKVFCRNSEWVGGHSGGGVMPSCKIVNCGKPSAPAHSKLTSENVS